MVHFESMFRSKCPAGILNLPELVAIAVRKSDTGGRSDHSPEGAWSARPPVSLLLTLRVSYRLCHDSETRLTAQACQGLSLPGSPDSGNVAWSCRFKPVRRVHNGHYQKSKSIPGTQKKGTISDNDALCKPAWRPDRQSGWQILIRVGRPIFRVVGLDTRQIGRQESQGLSVLAARGVPASFLAGSASAGTEPPKRARPAPSSPQPEPRTRRPGAVGRRRLSSGGRTHVRRRKGKGPGEPGPSDS